MLYTMILFVLSHGKSLEKNNRIGRSGVPYTTCCDWLDQLKWINVIVDWK